MSENHWMAHLGHKPDAYIHEQFGVALTRVSRTRRGLGISTNWLHRLHRTDWYALRLLYVEEQADHLGVTRATVTTYRRLIGLKVPTLQLGPRQVSWRSHAVDVTRGAHAYMASQIIDIDWLTSRGYATMEDLDAARAACRVKGFSAPMAPKLSEYADLLGKVPDSRLADLAHCPDHLVRSLRTLLQIPTCELHWMIDLSVLAAALHDADGVEVSELTNAWGWTASAVELAIRVGRLAA